MYDVNIVLTIVSGDPKSKQQCVLSLSDEKIIFPSFKPNRCDDLSVEIIDNISNYFTNNKSYIDSKFIFLLGVNSQNLNQLLSPSSNTINILYGITIPKYNINNGYFWKDFSFNDLSIPNELCLIGEAIRYGF
jgi:hypothetical protein